MFWKRGWLLSTLNYHVEKDIRETLYQNDIFKNNRWSQIERLVIWGAKHIVLANLILIIIALLLSSFISTKYDFLKQLLPLSLNGLTSIIEFQSIIFGAQVTLLGLIFPLVIAFIGILLQGKSSNESMWTVYRNNSGFMLVGFSALTISMAFILFKLMEPWLTYQETVAASISLTNWFLINLSLSGWFLWKTVKFLSLNSRMKMVAKYAINEAVPNDVRKRLLDKHCLSAIETGLLLKSKVNNLEIETYSSKDLSNKISHKFSKPKIITNIWYRLLNVGIWLLSIQVRLQNSTSEKFILCLPFQIDGRSQKDFILAKTNGRKINSLSAFIIRLSVRTSAKRVSVSLDMEKMMGALFGQIEDSLKDNNFRLFNSAKDDLIRFHKKIESSMFFINNDGEPDNWLLLYEGRWLGRNFLDVFVRESTSIAKEVTRRIQDDANYYESWCYLYTELFSRQRLNFPIKIAGAYIDGHYFIWGNLMSWMGGFNSNDLVSIQQRDGAIKHFIGSWEYWRMLLNKDFKSVDQNHYFCATRHLTNTSSMLIHATKYENFDAARWATDVLVHWYELFSNNQLGYHYYSWHHELITPQILRRTPDHSIRKAISVNNDLIDSEATSIALRNYWTDIRCLTAAYLLGSSKYNSNNSYKEYIDALLGCIGLEPTENIEVDQTPLSNAKELLGVYLRQNGRWDTQYDYNSLLEQHLNRLAVIEEPEWVSGRIYFYSGTKKDLYLPNFFKVFGVGLTVKEFTLDHKWLTFLKSNAVSQGDLESTITELEKLVSIDESIIDLVSNQFDINNAESQKKSKLFVQSINAIISDLKYNISSQILKAPIDQKRLLQFGIVASGSTFTLTDGPIPISFFQDIEYLDNFSADVVLTNITDYKKSEVSEGIDVNRAVNEGEWLNDIVKQRAKIVSFHQLLRQCSWEKTEFEDTLELISSAVNDSELIKSEGLSPVMFVGSWDVYQLINSSKWRYGKEDDRLPFDILVESEKDNGYICHLAGIEIYRLPFGKSDFSILLPMETFQRINIKCFGDERYVDATFATESNTDLTGTLSLTFGIECEFKVTKCFEYLSLNPDE